LKASGRRLWRATVEVFELEEHELVLLREVCRTADAIDALQSVVDGDGVLNESPHGLRAHPALVELRAQRTCFARLAAQLGLPTGEQDSPAAGVKQRRPPRGVYGITGVVVS
jgi:hypothetical protein